MPAEEKQDLEQMMASLQQMEAEVARLRAEAAAEESPATKAEAPKAAAKTEALPFAAFNQIATADRKGSLLIIRAQDQATLTAAVEYERQHRNRKQVMAWLQDTLGRLQQGLPATPSRGRPSLPSLIPSKSEKQSEAQPEAQPEAQAPQVASRGKQRGRPSLTDRPLEMVGVAPLADYPTWSITSTDPATNSRQRILQIEDADLLAKLLAFEQAQPNPRKTVVSLMERRLRGLQGAGAGGGRIAHDPALLPFPDYTKIASSRQKESRAILNAQSEDTLQKALVYEHDVVGRVQITDMISKVIEQKQYAAIPEPFPGYGEVASSKPTFTRRLLRSRSPQELQAALTYEQQGLARKQIIRAIEDALKRSGAPGPAPAIKPSPASPAAEPGVAATLPFSGFDQIRSADRKGSLLIIRAQDQARLEAGVEYERQHSNRKQVMAWLQETLQRVQQGLPATPSRGRPAIAGTSKIAPAAPVAAKPATPAADLPFAGFDQIRSADRKGSLLIIRAQDQARLEASVEYERQHSNRKQVLAWLEETLQRVQQGLPATPSRGRPVTAGASTAVVAPSQVTDLPFPGYDQVASSRITESRALLVGRSVEDLQAAELYEREHENRIKVLQLLEGLIRQKESGKVRAGRGAGQQPLEDYDALPTEIVVRTVQRGSVDDRLAQILAYERENGGRAEIVREVEERMAAPRDQQIVSPGGRVWRGREPWNGYGGLDHNDKQGMLRAFRDRSVGEIRRAAAAETQQDFPASAAMEAASEIINEREQQPA